MTILAEVKALGQQIWLDNLSRSLLENGTLARLLADGVCGVTSNPAIFQKAFAGDELYRADIARLKRAGADTGADLRNAGGGRRSGCLRHLPGRISAQRRQQRLGEPGSGARAGAQRRRHHRRSPPPAHAARAPQRHDQNPPPPMPASKPLKRLPPKASALI